MAPKGKSGGKPSASASASSASSSSSAAAAGAALAGPKLKENPHCKLVRVFGREGLKAGQFSDPSHVVVGGDELYVVDTENHRIQGRNCAAILLFFSCPHASGANLCGVLCCDVLCGGQCFR
jgi:hypothetical protein